MNKWKMENKAKNAFNKKYLLDKGSLSFFLIYEQDIWSLLSHSAYLIRKCLFGFCSLNPN